MNCDVIVVGFGTSGAIAAIAAGREGSKVLVLERGSYPGGLQTGGFITEYFLQGPVGLASELELEAVRLCESGGYASCEEPKKLVLERAALLAGVDIRYEVRIDEALMDGRRIRGLAWTEGGRKFKACAGMVIDATANAAVASLAGCELSSGRPWDGRCQHASNIFKFLKGSGSGARYGYIAPPIRVEHECICEFSLAVLKSAAEILSEEREGQRIVSPSDQPGMREGGHIVPARPFSMDSCLLEAFDEEPVAFAYSAFDTNITDSALESESFQDWMIVAGMWGVKLWFAIPKRALIPHDVKGLLAAGRHLGVGHDLGHALRMNSAMGAVGEAAGRIAAMSVRTGMEPHEVPFHAVRPPEADNEALWGLSDKDIEEGLASQTPGKAIWSSYRAGKGDLLCRLLENARSSDLKAHAVFALALLRDRKAIPPLRDMAERLDNSVVDSPDCDRAPHGVIATYLLGRFKDSGAVNILLGILSRRGIEYEFEYHSNAIVSLVKIGDAHLGTRELVASGLLAVMKDESWRLDARFIKYLPGKVRMDGEFRRFAEDAMGRWG